MINDKMYNINNVYLFKRIFKAHQKLGYKGLVVEMSVDVSTLIHLSENMDMKMLTIFKLYKIGINQVIM